MTSRIRSSVIGQCPYFLALGAICAGCMFAVGCLQPNLPNQTASASSPSADGESGSTDVQSKDNDDQRTGQKDQRASSHERLDAKPTRTEARVVDVYAALDLGQLPHAKSAERFGTTMYFTTSMKRDHAFVEMCDALEQRGFKPGDSFRTKMLGLSIEAGTIWLETAIEDNSTLVHIYLRESELDADDLAQLPILPDAKTVDRNSGEIKYKSTMSVPEAARWLERKFGELAVDVQRIRESDCLIRQYFNDGTLAVCAADELTDATSGAVSTDLRVAAYSSLDTTVLPRPGAIEHYAFTPYGSHEFITSNSPADSVKAATDELRQLGWQPVESIRESIADYEQILLKKGTLLQLRADAFGDSRTHFTYYTNLLPFDLPDQGQVRSIRVDAGMPQLFFISDLPPATLVSFYENHLPAVGWKLQQPAQKLSENSYRLLLTQGQRQAIELTIESKGPSTTWVESVPFNIPLANVPRATAGGEDVRANSEPEVELPEIAAVDEQTPHSLGEEDDPQATMRNLMARQFQAALSELPVEERAEARKVLQDALAQQFGNTSASKSASESAPAETMVNRSSQDLAAFAQGLFDVGAELDAKLSDDTVRDTSHQPEMEPSEQIEKRRAVPEGKFAAEDFPIPDSAADVDLGFEMITFNLDEVKSAAKFYNEKLVELGWKTRGEQMIENDMAFMKFQKGTGTIDIRIIEDDRNDPPVMAIIQGDGIVFPDPYADDPDMQQFAGVDAESRENDPLMDSDEPEEFEGITMPPGLQDTYTSGTRFRQEFHSSLNGDLKETYEYFRKAAAESGWKETTQSFDSDEQATLAFSNQRGELHIKLDRSDAEIDFVVSFRDPAVAKQAGFLPEKGKARLILGNAADAAVTITINQTEYKLAAGQGADDPRDGLTFDVAPGVYNCQIAGAGRKSENEKLRVTAGGTWGLIVFPDEGYMAEQMY
ncbi:MAG: hypothetical protein R3C53_04595 [Pirellulaceae bacterium]